MVMTVIMALVSIHTKVGQKKNLPSSFPFGECQGETVENFLLYDHTLVVDDVNSPS